MILRAPVGLLPVLVFLFVLVYMDSYKLVGLKTVLGVIFFGALTAVAAYWLNPVVMDALGMAFKPYSRYAAPVVEEALKALVMVFLFRTSRIGFLVDAAIMGFAVGAGFALVENFLYLQQGAGTNMGVWIVRGFGTAIMHGGATAIFGIMAQTLTERSMRINPVYYLPGLLVASVLHSIYNHFFVAPILQTVGTLLVLPPLLALVFSKSTQAMHDWLELDFDADARLIEMISSHEFAESKVGRFLTDLRNKFEGPVVADMLCYLRIRAGDPRERRVDDAAKRYRSTRRRTHPGEIRGTPIPGKEHRQDRLPRHAPLPADGAQGPLATQRDLVTSGSGGVLCGLVPPLTFLGPELRGLVVLLERGHIRIQHHPGLF